MRNYAARALVTLAIASFLIVSGRMPGAGAQEAAGDYDYLALVLSWSPTYCASDAGRNDHAQCAPGRRYAFVVHGLWPQRERGWPEYCESDARYLPEATIGTMRDIMPSRALIIHEWRKHGTCSGLGQQGYFATTRTLFARLRIPARYIAPQAAVVTTPQELIDDFLKTNLWLKPATISVHCGNRRDTGRLADLRLCFGKDLQPRACGANERYACRAQELVLPPVR